MSVPVNQKTANGVNVPKKADVILQTEREILARQNESIQRQSEAMIKQNDVLAKQSELLGKTVQLDSRVNHALDQLAKARQDVALSARQSDEIYSSLKNDYASLRTELKYLAAQSENIFLSLNETIGKLAVQNEHIYKSLSESIAQLAGEIDELKASSESVAEPAEEISELVAEPVAEPVAEAEPIAEEPAVKAAEPEVVQTAIDYDKIIDYNRLAFDYDRMIDYDKLAQKVAELIPVQEVISPDLIASKVAEQIIIPESGAATATLDFNEDEFADRMALKVGSLKNEDFDIIVDDDGCAAVAKEIVDRLDYDLITASVAEKLRTALEASAEEPDYEEMATKISEKIAMPSVNEEAIADKAAAALSNYLPEIDVDEIADKVTEQVVSALPAVDTEAIVNGVGEKVASVQECIVNGVGEKITSMQESMVNEISERLIASQAEQDYDIVIDEEGVEKLSSRVCAKVGESVSGQLSDVDGRFDGLNGRIDEMFGRFDGINGSFDTVNGKVDEVNDRLNGLTLDGVTEKLDETNGKIDGVNGRLEEAGTRFDAVDGEIREIKSMLAAGVAVQTAIADAYAEESYETEESLITVSGVMEEENEDDRSAEELTEDMDEIVEELGEQPSEGEIMPDGLEENAGGVDFINMMKYNRSFIARIIQGSDEQKNYYGAVKSALLSYNKVNSNIAWGAERFHKGRETIARFKIRGKTLCLYLALDPKEYPYSVYHQADVSDNKSMSGTPMMVKIKSPRGVKKAIRLIDEMLAKRNGVKRKIVERDYAAMYPYETMEELIEEGLVKDVSKNK